MDAAATGAQEPFPWRVVALLGVTQLGAWGALYYAITLLAARIMAETGWPSAIVHGGFALALMLAAIAGPETGRLQDKYGGARVMAAAALIAAAGLALIAVAQTPAVYLFGWAVTGIAIAGALYDPAFVLIAQVAPTRARSAITALTLIGGFASTVSWPITYGLLATFDWREIYLIFAAFQALVAAPIYAFVLARAPRRGAPKALAAGSAGASGGHAARSVLFWAIALAFAVNTFITTALTLHLVPALSSFPAIGERDAVLAGMAFGPAQVLARIGELVWLRRLPPYALALTAFGLMPFAMGAMAFAGLSWTGAFVATAVAGAGNGLMTIARGVLPLHLFGHARFGANLGLFAAPGRFAMALAPVGFALMLERMGVATSFQILFTLSLASCAVIVALRR